MPIFQIHVNAATNERFFSQTGLTHTRLRNRLVAATVTKIAQLRAELNRSKPPRKKPRIVSQSQPSASSSSQGQVDDNNLDLDTLTSADEFEAEVNEWMNELALEAASSDDSVPLMETPAIQKAKLSSIFGSALQPLSNEDLLANY